jgi:tetratricopeptide (TPR) repeat protein
MSSLTRSWSLVVLGAALAAYVPTVGHGFAFDDDIVIVRNRHLRSLAGIPDLLTRTEWAGGGIELRQWRPLTALTYAANHALTGLAPWSYHLANVLLHALAALLVLRLGRRWGLSPGAAGLAALLFAVHPIHVEAVANVVGRKDVLATVLLLAMALLHEPALRRGGARLALPILAYAGAMLSKEVGVVGVGLVLLQDLLLPDPPGLVPRRRRVALYAGYAAALVAYLAAYSAVAGLGAPPAIPFVDNPAAHGPGAIRVLTAIAVIGKGLLLQLLPAGQSPDWSFDAIPLVRSPLDPRLLAAATILLACTAAAIALRRRAPVFSLALGWYLVTLLPASNLLFPVGTLFGERLLYAPSVAFAILAGIGLAALLRPVPRRIQVVATAAVAITLAGTTVRYSAAWADEAALFRLAASNAPRSAKVHHKLAEVLLRDGRAAEALPEIRRAIGILPGDARAEALHADVLRALGQTEDARAALLRALAADPRSADALYGMGRLARDAGRLDEAAGYWRRAIEADPRHAAALADLASYHLVRGETGLALALSERAVAANDAQANAWYNLGMIRRAGGDRAGARSALERFVQTAGREYAAEAAAVRAALERGEP